MTADAKLAALMAPRSQFETTHEIVDADDPGQVARFRRKMADRAADHGALAGLAYGERFKLIGKV